MRRLIVLCFVLIVFLAPASVFAASCDSAGDEYYIKFIFEGKEYVCSYGHPSSDVDVPYAAVTTPLLFNGPAEYIQFLGSSSDTMDENPDFFIEVGGTLYVMTAGNYTGEYQLPDYGYAFIDISEGEGVYYYFLSSGTVTINSFGAIGEAVEGTFNATFVLPTAIGDTPQEVSGSFRVKRIAPEDLPPMIN